MAKGCFVNPDTMFEQTEWKKFGDKLFDEVISDNKTAKKLMKPWRAVTNALAVHQAEQKVAAAAAERLGRPDGFKEPPHAEVSPVSPYPSPPSIRTFTIAQGGSGNTGLPKGVTSVSYTHLTLPTNVNV